MKKVRTSLMPILINLVGISSALPQSLSISGRITDSASNTGLSGANIQILLTETQEVKMGTATDSLGEYAVGALAPGRYSMVVTHIGYLETAKTVELSQNFQNINFALRPTSIGLDPVTVTASRRTEKRLAAPTALTVLLPDDIQRTATITIADQLESVPSVDVAKGGLARSNISIRGFNHNFLSNMMVFNRQPSGPSPGPADL